MCHNYVGLRIGAGHFFFFIVTLIGLSSAGVCLVFCIGAVIGVFTVAQNLYSLVFTFSLVRCCTVQGGVCDPSSFLCFFHACVWYPTYVYALCICLSVCLSVCLPVYRMLLHVSMTVLYMRLCAQCWHVFVLYCFHLHTTIIQHFSSTGVYWLPDQSGQCTSLAQLATMDQSVQICFCCKY